MSHVYRQPFNYAAQLALLTVQALPVTQTEPDAFQGDGFQHAAPKAFQGSPPASAFDNFARPFSHAPWLRERTRYAVREPNFAPFLTQPSAPFIFQGPELQEVGAYRRAEPVRALVSLSVLQQAPAVPFVPFKVELGATQRRERTREVQNLQPLAAVFDDTVLVVVGDAVQPQAAHTRRVDHYQPPRTQFFTGVAASVFMPPTPVKRGRVDPRADVRITLSMTVFAEPPPPPPDFVPPARSQQWSREAYPHPRVQSHALQVEQQDFLAKAALQLPVRSADGRRYLPAWQPAPFLTQPSAPFIFSARHQLQHALQRPRETGVLPMPKVVPQEFIFVQPRVIVYPSAGRQVAIEVDNVVSISAPRTFS